jgi:hypothetical protein
VPFLPGQFKTEVIVVVAVVVVVVVAAASAVKIRKKQFPLYYMTVLEKRGNGSLTLIFVTHICGNSYNFYIKTESCGGMDGNLMLYEL